MKYIQVIIGSWDLVLAMDSRKRNVYIYINCKMNSSLGFYFLLFILNTNYLVLSKKQPLSLVCEFLLVHGN